jgi:hypothetical protein
MTQNNSTSSLNQLLQKLGEITHRTDVDPDTPLGELGVDSLSLVEMILVCDQIYPGVNAAESGSITQFTTLRELDAQLASQVQSAVQA